MVDSVAFYFLSNTS